MAKNKKARASYGYVEAVLIPLARKNLIILRGKKGYIMCGYLDLKVAEKFNDVAAKIVGVSSIRDALKAKVHSCTSGARKLGLRKGQPVREALKLIA